MSALMTGLMTSIAHMTTAHMTAAHTTAAHTTDLSLQCRCLLSAAVDADEVEAEAKAAVTPAACRFTTSFRTCLPFERC